VAKAQEEIAELLPARDEYVVTSSEFDGIKQRLSVMLAGRKLEEEDDNRPTLRRKKRDKKDGEEEEKDDEPPVLRRRN
jgi:hypothetical protein